MFMYLKTNCLAPLEQKGDELTQSYVPLISCYKILISFDGNCIFSKYIHELVGNIDTILN